MKKLAAALVLALGACTVPQPPTTPARPEMVLQIYDVPQGSAGDLRQALARVLDTPKDSPELPTGHVTVTPDGRVLVLAPEKVQTGVRAIVEQVSKRPAQPPVRIDMNYWFVLGKQVPAGDKTELPVELGEIKPALDELVRTQGPMQFRKLEHLRMSTIAGENGRVDSGRISARQDVSTTSGVVLARVSLNTGPRSIDTTVQLRPEQLVVLGQTGWKEKDGGEKDAKDGAEEQTLFYVMRADLRNAPEPKQP
ncbi:MAG TPA: hypothetical protein VGK67_29370 [Myxococcales bacterium]|jgi:hypothetical protein